MAAKRSSRKADQSYKETVLPGSNKKVVVNSVPESLINSIMPDRPRPRRPQIEMQTKAGTQVRAAKSGDPEYDAWEDDVAEWEQERDDLQSDYRLAIALRGELPQDAAGGVLDDKLVFPADTQELIDCGAVELPTGRHAKHQIRAMWLKATVVRGLGDEMEVFYTSQEVSGVDPEVVAEMRNRFRNNLLRSSTQLVGTEAEVGEDAGSTSEDVPL